MMIRLLRLAALAASVLAGQSALAGHFTCRVTLSEEDGLKAEETSDARHLIFKIVETGNGLAEVQVGSASDQGEVATGEKLKTKFKNAPFRKADDGSYQLDATPDNAVDSESAGCNKRQYYYNIHMKPRDAGGFNADIEITPFYRKGEQDGKCIAFAAPELITESHRDALCIRKD